VRWMKKRHLSYQASELRPGNEEQGKTITRI
jgi:hypothetical protein